MEASVKQRLIEFIRYKGISQRKFEQNVSLSNGFVNNISKGIGADKLQKILSIYPDLNQAWLLTGEGEMLADTSQDKGIAASNNTNSNIASQINDSAVIMRLLDQLAEKDKQINHLLEIISKLSK